MYTRPWFLRAPLVICVCGVPEEAWVGAVPLLLTTLGDAADRPLRMRE